jgi:GGDEF domain-containing protein
MGGKRNLVLGRCAALLFLCGAIASLPTNAILGAAPGAYAVDALALVSALICLTVPWNRVDRRWLHILVLVATAEVVLAVAIHARHAAVFTWYFALVAVFVGYAFRRRQEVALQLGVAVVGMASTAIYASGRDPDAVANAIVGVPTIVVAAGVVVWLRENLERRERTDPLTGLGNRRALMEALEEVVDNRLVRLLVLFDLDGFKRYNDQLGHAAGDALLERLGAQLLEAVGSRGEAFRLGGDELCVVLVDSSVLGDCEAALRADGVGASHGSAWLPHEADSASGALSLADDRMYAAKRAAREVPFVLAMEPRSGSGSASAAAPNPAR